MVTKSVLWILSLAAMGATCMALGAGIQFSAEPRWASVVAARLKDKFQLDDVVAADRNEKSRASGVIKEEDQAQGYLLLLTHDVCESEGASGIVFTKPYSKTKLEEPADCDGEKIDRYRVEQE